MNGPGCKECPFKDDRAECYDALIYGYCSENDDYEDDIGSATVREMRLQNGDY